MRMVAYLSTLLRYDGVYALYNLPQGAQVPPAAAQPVAAQMRAFETNIRARAQDDNPAGAEDIQYALNILDVFGPF